MRVSPFNLQMLAYTLEVEGHDSARVLARCGLPPLSAVGSLDWLPVGRMEDLIEACLDATGDSSFGLVAGKSVAQMRYGLISTLVLYTPSLRRAFEDIVRFTPLFLERPELSLSETAECARLRIDLVVQREAAVRFRSESVCMGLVQMLRLAGIGRVDIHGVDLPFEAPHSLDRHMTLLGPVVRFGQAHCEIRFDAAVLDTPIATHDPAAYLAARTRAEVALSAIGQRMSLVRRVGDMLAASLPRPLTAAECARALGISERSLRRQLAAEGACYADLCRASQQLMAERLLAERERPIKDVADQLGFASVSSFHRAFRRWTDMTPLEWRGHRP